ncbi:MAG TPA: DUF2065 domain-containing protein [Steroidobacteraceae bacterium]|nr:DUF2065 domain-containing protein [Steroidobacteraceae bacterium]
MVELNWAELGAGLAIASVLEGMLPFLSPPAMRRLLERLLAMDDRELRLGGLFSMLAGLAILYLVR